MRAGRESGHAPPRKAARRRQNITRRRCAKSTLMAAGLCCPQDSGEPDGLAGTRSRCPKARDENAESSILARVADSGDAGTQDGEMRTFAGGRCDSRSLAAEGATAHACAADPHSAPLQCCRILGHSSEYRGHGQGVSRRVWQISDCPAPMDRSPDYWRDGRWLSVSSPTGVRRACHHGERGIIVPPQEKETSLGRHPGVVGSWSQGTLFQGFSSAAGRDWDVSINPVP